MLRSQGTLSTCFVRGAASPRQPVLPTSRNRPRSPEVLARVRIRGSFQPTLDGASMILNIPSIKMKGRSTRSVCLVCSDVRSLRNRSRVNGVLTSTKTGFLYTYDRDLDLKSCRLLERA